jgi:3'-5' exonuclease
MSNEDVKNYILDLLKNSAIQKVTHTFGVDTYLLAKGFDVEELEYENVVDLSQLIKEEGSDNSLGLKTLVEKFKKKALNQYYKKSNWSKRPIEQNLIDYAALNTWIILQVLLSYEAQSKKTKHALFEVVTLKDTPYVGTWPNDADDEKKPARKAEKTTERRGGRRPAPKREAEPAEEKAKRPAPKWESEPAEEKAKRPARGRGGRRPENSESNVNTHEDTPQSSRGGRGSRRGPREQ